MTDVYYTIFLVGVTSVEGVLRATCQWYGYCSVTGFRGDCLWITLHQQSWYLTTGGDEEFFASLVLSGLIGEYTVRREVMEV